MATILMITLSVLVLDLAAMIWGVDSREGINSREWERRQAWRGWH